MTFFIFGMILVLGLIFAAKAFTSFSPGQLAQAFRAFMAAFTTLAGTGLLFMGRFGLAMATLGAAAMAFYSLRQHAKGASVSSGPMGAASSDIETDMLTMALDHGSGDLEGEVLRGRFAGRSLNSLGLKDLIALMIECHQDDPRAVPLLETYLDRRQPDWRDHIDEQDDAFGASAPSPDGMDDITAYSILDLAPGADEEAIKAAHRRLMTKLHPDRGGSSYIATQLNQAKDHLLQRRD